MLFLWFLLFRLLKILYLIYTWNFTYWGIIASGVDFRSESRYFVWWKYAKPFAHRADHKGWQCMWRKTSEVSHRLSACDTSELGAVTSTCVRLLTLTWKESIDNASTSLKRSSGFSRHSGPKCSSTSWSWDTVRRHTTPWSPTQTRPGQSSLTHILLHPVSPRPFPVSHSSPTFSSTQSVPDPSRSVIPHPHFPPPSQSCVFISQSSLCCWCNSCSRNDCLC